MGANKAKRWFLFGGLGFIGQHLAASILRETPNDRVVLLDLRTPENAGWNPALTHLAADNRVKFAACDVRQPIHLDDRPAPGDVLVNLAAVHREPGHRRDEYFKTNLEGAQNITRLAEECGCGEIIFTSSISVYGEFEHVVDEDSTPQPKTAYGQSKLQAEQIHRDWASRTGGRLSIIRPGVVFGPGEGGNVSRLVKESLRRKRAIFLKPDLAKAGIYIEELVSAIHWLRDRTAESKGPLLINGVSRELLHFNDYGRLLVEMQAFKQKPLIIPTRALALALPIAKPLGGLVSTASRFHPERLLKLTRPNAIESRRLQEWGYSFEWPLERAMIDWLRRGI